ncbi:MAG: LCP family protein [Anaerolineae bacterium]|nr:LCP family protein [Anaerolineae bacterium]
MRVSPLAFLVLILVVALLTAGGAVAVYLGVRQLVVESPIDLPPPPQVNGSGAANANSPRATPVPLVGQATATPTHAPNETPEPGETPASPVNDGQTDAQPGALSAWSSPTRFTVLLLGIDQRPQEEGPFRTDTIIVLSIDPVRKRAAMLSIPRDVYVPIPGYEGTNYSPNRINTANYIGDLTEYPGGGPALAKRAVQALIGIPIDRYVLVNFEAFRIIIDALGPVEVCPQERIFDDNYPDTDTYGVITVEFQPGCQELDATRLLQYARVRHNAGDDFGRALRQQEVIRAVKDKALSLGGVSALIGQAGAVWDALRDNLRTDLTFDEIVQLASLGEGIGDIDSAVLSIRADNKGELLPSQLPSGEDVLTPVYEAVYDLVVRLFDSGTGGQGDPRASDENASISVLNGAGIDGLAGTTADRLRAVGFNVVNVANAEGVGLYGSSEIRVYSSKFSTARFLAETLGLDSVLIQAAQNGPPGVDIELIVGRDLAGQ